MIQIDLSTLINRLNPITRQAMENAAARCVHEQQSEITVSLFLLQLLDVSLCDVPLICEKSTVQIDKFITQLSYFTPPNQLISQESPSFSPLLVEWLKDSWLLASAEMQHSQLRSGVMLLTLLQTPYRYLSRPAAELLTPINREQFKLYFDTWLSSSIENNTESRDNMMATVSSESLLSRFSQNMTQQAADGRFDPVLCRDHEIDLLIDILCRRRKNNPIVVGEPGVGKSALIEGLALRIVANDVPEKLKKSQLLTLDLAAMQAGAAVKGEFEKRFKGIIQEINQSAQPIILFIDEAHTLIGTGNAQGGLDVSNLLKPALARGELKTIAATTWNEYKKYFEKDAALTRRFEQVPVKEPTAAEATIIMRGLRAVYESAHGVFIDDEAVCACAELSARYLSGRQLPDKAIDVLDTACARTAINLTSPPKKLSTLKTKLYQYSMEQDLLVHEQQLGLHNHTERLSKLTNKSEELKQQLTSLQNDWETQQNLVNQIIRLRSQLSESISDNCHDMNNIAVIKMQLNQLTNELDKLQQYSMLISPHVDKHQVAAVIAEWTGVPLNRLSQDALSVVTELPRYLEQSIKGQTLAIADLHKHLLTARADLRRSGRPLGAFLLAGPSGVGKTETVIQIAQLMFGGNQYLTVINMSEFQEKHTISRLIGAPPGYVGFGEGGILTEAIRRKPYSVVLLDEVEKAHPDILNLFYQAFDKGELADGEGRIIDCKNIAFFLTSNLGDQIIVDNADQPDLLRDALYPELTRFFRPALLARMEIIPYLPLNQETLTSIVQDKLSYLENRLKQRFNAEVIIEDEVYNEILIRANRSENGARILESIIDGALLPPLSLLLLQYAAHGDDISIIKLSVKNHEFIAQINNNPVTP
ncbi:type VI secretion system ATPase TssH [Moellerella wisconsensis]|uniref:Type VI secretion system ATPase TssH n=1 Tax=Moellerella wisconsensis TaxID=158849 RepID=A0ACD3Y4F4_9GAMM|nr:type VI secretion system ATPase TssH [Moellerella wisconsensis]UNH37958.1 type VI secretion system ATPase TssH [Moellerella wisconsensis]